MASNTRDLRRRIRSVKSTQQITKAMELVAASALKTAQQRVERARPYAQKMEDVIGSIASASSAIRHPMLVKRPVAKTGYIVISSDRGLAGSYNSQVIRHTMGLIRSKPKESYVLFTIGRKARDFFQKRDYPVIGELVGLSDEPTYAETRNLARSVVTLFENGTYDEVYLIYNEFVSPLTQVAIDRKLLPLEEVGQREQTGAKMNYLYEPSAEAVLEELLPRFAETLIFSALLEAKASEHGSRMTAMGNATENAGEMIDTLTLALNRARQAAITVQIAEIVGGAAALQ